MIIFFILFVNLGMVLGTKVCHTEKPADLSEKCNEAILLDTNEGNCEAEKKINNGDSENVKESRSDMNYVLIMISPDVPGDPNCKGVFGDVKFPMHRTIKPLNEEQHSGSCSAPGNKKHHPRDIKKTCTDMLHKSVLDLVNWVQREKKMNTVSITVSNLYVDQNKVVKVVRSPEKASSEKTKSRSSNKHHHHSNNHNTHHNRKILPHPIIYRSARSHKVHKYLDQGDPVDDIYDFDLFPEEKALDLQMVPTESPLDANLIAMTRVEEAPLDQIIADFTSSKPIPKKEITEGAEKYDDKVYDDIADMVSDVVSSVASDVTYSVTTERDITSKRHQKFRTPHSTTSELPKRTTDVENNFHDEENDETLGILRKVNGKSANGLPMYELVPPDMLNSRKPSYSEKNDLNLSNTPRNIKIFDKKDTAIDAEYDEDLDATTEALLKYRTTSTPNADIKTTRAYLQHSSIDMSEGSKDDNAGSNSEGINEDLPTIAPESCTYYTNESEEPDLSSVQKGTSTNKLLEATNQPPLLDIMSVLKQQFFHTFLDTMSLDEKGSSPSLLAMTRNLFKQIESYPSVNGYLALINGGNVSDLKNCSSDLVKTLHFIFSASDLEKTVIVLTATCPSANNNLPFLVAGPNIDNFKNVVTLQDVPNQIKNHIQHNGGTRNNNNNNNNNIHDRNNNNYNNAKKHVKSDIRNGRHNIQRKHRITNAPRQRINQLFESFPNSETFGDELAESLVAPSDIWYSDIQLDSDAQFVDYDKMAMDEGYESESHNQVQEPNFDQEHEMVKRESSTNTHLSIKNGKLVILGVIVNIAITVNLL